MSRPEPQYDMDNEKSVCYKIKWAICNQENFSEHVIDGFSPAECRSRFSKETLLHITAWRGNQVTAQDLVEKYNINVNDTDLLGDTALHYAVTLHNPGVLKKLLEIGANPLLRNTSGNTPRDLAQREFEPTNEILSILSKAEEYSAQQMACFSRKILLIE
jgi:ankyrin repeat protein